MTIYSIHKTSFNLRLFSVDLSLIMLTSIKSVKKLSLLSSLPVQWFRCPGAGSPSRQDAVTLRCGSIYSRVISADTIRPFIKNSLKARGRWHMMRPGNCRHAATWGCYTFDFCRALEGIDQLSAKYYTQHRGPSLCLRQAQGCLPARRRLARTRGSEVKTLGGEFNLWGQGSYWLPSFWRRTAQEANISVAVSDKSTCWREGMRLDYFVRTEGDGVTEDGGVSYFVH